MINKSPISSSNPVADVGTGATGCSAKTSHAETLDAIARDIVERDSALKEAASRCWLENGRSLLKAKSLLAHGEFESWCRSKLGYSKSKAEKLMRAASVLGPHFKSVRVTDLPAPTLAYALSASSVSDDIRKEFVPRIIAGEKKVMSNLKRAIDDHQRRIKEAKKPDLQESPQLAPMSEDIKGFLDLIVKRLGNDLPKMMEIVAKLKAGAIFNPRIEQALRVKTQHQANFEQMRSKFSRDEDTSARNLIVETNPSTTGSMGAAGNEKIGDVKSRKDDTRYLSSINAHQGASDQQALRRHAQVTGGKLDPWNQHLADKQARRALGRR